MKKIILISALLLCGCNTVTPNIITNRATVVVPADSMYACPVLTNLPKVDTLTDVEVAKVMVELYKDNRMCRSSMNAIRKYLADAKARIESSK